MTARKTYLFFVFFALTLFSPHQKAADETPAEKNKKPYVESPANRWVLRPSSKGLKRHLMPIPPSK